MKGIKFISAHVVATLNYEVLVSFQRENETQKDLSLKSETQKTFCQMLQDQREKKKGRESQLVMW